MIKETLKDLLNQNYTSDRKLKIYTSYYGYLMFKVYVKNYAMVNRLFKIKVKLRSYDSRRML